ncbi:MAG: hypothetical protein CM1200mP36_02120 [Gammaproteobacteria bacterium]|nr:MAG: hypothetical protein CM1200mP36_02120 [Gammaproteobacteria bacterium]
MAQFRLPVNSRVKSGRTYKATPGRRMSGRFPFTGTTRILARIQPLTPMMWKGRLRAYGPRRPH